MKFLYAPRISWVTFLAYTVVFGLLSWEDPDPLFVAQTIGVMIVLLVVDFLVRSHLHHLALVEREKAEELDRLKNEDAERNPKILERLHIAEQRCLQLDQEGESLRLDLDIARTDRQKAEAEREDIRKLLDFNRALYRTEQLESQDLRDQLERLQVQKACDVASTLTSKDGPL